MFGRLLQEFDEDPFFSDPFSSHREHVRHMMRSFSEPFGRDPFFSITGDVERSDRRLAKRDNQMDSLPVGPDAHSFSSSSVMTYSKVGNEPPKVFQASSATRQAPGGIKETIKGVKDSESGIEKMAVGHHIKDRAYVIKKARNNKTGNEEVHQDFVNLDECEGPAFDEEWERKMKSFQPLGGRNHLTGNHNYTPRHAIKNN
ncbi:myeloid leukemia factor 1 isoform X2 [Pleurodeles waltl]|uniref:myeloid leukemia factor 1 isoform X2 n=1 Tax=Pleurodeles waltl TaxID=8319 RepID=UPI003709404A